MRTFGPAHAEGLRKSLFTEKPVTVVCGSYNHIRRHTAFPKAREGVQSLPSRGKGHLQPGRITGRAQSAPFPGRSQHDMTHPGKRKISPPEAGGEKHLMAALGKRRRQRAERAGKGMIDKQNPHGVFP